MSSNYKIEINDYQRKLIEEAINELMLQRAEELKAAEGDPTLRGICSSMDTAYEEAGMLLSLFRGLPDVNKDFPDLLNCFTL